MKVAVTGATGYVGRFFVESALDAGHQVMLLTRSFKTETRAGTQVTPYRLGDRPDLAGIDRLIHCAFSHVPGRYRGGEGTDPHGFIAANLDGTRALFEAARKDGVGQVVFLSTRAVYGSHDYGCAPHEGLTPQPDSLYGRVKLAAEQALAELTGPALTGVSLRATGVYGAATPDAPHKWQDLFASFLKGAPIAPRAGTEVFGGDVVTAAECALSAGSGVYNVSDLVVDRHDLLAMVNDALGVSHPLPDRAEAPANRMDIGKLTALGWSPGGKPQLMRVLPGLLPTGN